MTDGKWERVEHRFVPASTGLPPGDYRQRVDAVEVASRRGVPMTPEWLSALAAVERLAGTAAEEQLDSVSRSVAVDCLARGCTSLCELLRPGPLTTAWPGAPVFAVTQALDLLEPSAEGAARARKELLARIRLHLLEWAFGEGTP